MKSLLEKIQVVENEASALIRKTEEAGEKAIYELTASEQTMIDSTKAKAQKKAGDIINERTSKAQSELGSFTEEATQAIALTHTAAQKNRAFALEVAEQLLTKELIKK